MGGFKVPEAEESVGCNLIPMIDIMFLLLLFFMLGADMSQRELENVTLPKADQIKEDSKTREKHGRTTVNIHLRDEEAETEKLPPTYLQDPQNWVVVVRGRPFDWPALKTQLEEEGKLDMEEQVDPVAKKRLSGRSVQIRADQQAPYGLIQKVIDVAAQAGLYKIEVAAARPEPTK
jgi:biopolymer transport protein ExbD